MNLLNTYIKNDDGELRELYIKEAEKQGFVQSENTSNNYTSRYITVSESYNEIWSVSSSRMHTDKELTLKDLVDPYEELKQAYKEGKTIQILGFDDEWVDLVGEPNFKSRIEFYRIKPEESCEQPTTTENTKTKPENDVNTIPEQNTDLTLTEVQNALPEDFYLRVYSDKFVIINHNTRQKYTANSEEDLSKVLDTLVTLEEFKK